VTTSFAYRFENGLFLGQFQPQVPITGALLRTKTKLDTIQKAWRDRVRPGDPKLAEMPGRIVKIQIGVVE
jgi:hypothetical protein